MLSSSPTLIPVDAVRRGCRTDPTWLFRLVSESESFYRGAVGAMCLLIVALVVGLFWLTSPSSQK
jgi:hypothetical protein